MFETVRPSLCIALATSVVALFGGAGNAQAATPVDCSAEDSIGWSWSQCGDRSRGVVLKHTGGRVTVVSACEYRTLRRAKQIHTGKTRSLKGDGFALAHGCDR